MNKSLLRLGKRIRQLREARGLSQQQFAIVSGVHRTYIGHLERGKKNLSFTTLERVAVALGITVAQLVEDDKNTMRIRKPTAKSINSAEVKIIRVLDHGSLLLGETLDELRMMKRLLQSGEE